MYLRENQQTKGCQSEKGCPLIVALCSIAFFSYVGYIVYYFSYRGDATEIVAVANQFKPDPSWKLVSEDITVPQNFCLNSSCPQVCRSWEINGSYELEDLEKLVTQTGWSLSIEGTCVKNPRSFGAPTELCSAKGKVDKYKVSIIVSGSINQNNDEVTLIVEEE